ncbi:MAG: GspE/PulE family protein [Pseudomonadota bacterium]|nr:GspE/PulE family protein [Pseudomonadota bacterium]
MAASPQIATLLGSRGRLELDEVLAALVVDGHVLADDARNVRMGARAGRTTVELHPLVLIANAKLGNQREPGRPLSLEILTEWLASHAGLPYLKIDPMKINVAAVTQVVSMAYAKRHRILPIAATVGEVTFATCEPFENGWAPDLAQMLRRDIKRVVASPLDINRYLQEFYGVQRSIQLAQDAKTGSDSSASILNFEQLVELGKSGEVGADDRHVVHIVDWLLQYAFEQRASDIHLEPRREAGAIRFRIDGVMQKVFELPAPVMTAVTARIKILARMDVAEKRRPQDGRIKTRSASGREVELRISNMPTAFGEKVVMRIFDPDLVVKDFAQLGFSPGEGAHWRSMVERPHGIVLVTGPTGSGKTTTLYAALRTLNDGSSNILTVEDPVEYAMDGVGQTQVNPKVGLTFAAGLRAILRQDPDVVMVGEIRDRETAEIAVQASLTGHLVLSTVHTNDAVGAITRMRDMKIEPFLLASTLRAVIAQRLVRKLCGHCRRPVQASGSISALLGFDPGTVVYQAVGCEQCAQTGFKGRIGVFEAIRIDDTIRRLINDGGDEAIIARHAFLHAPNLGSAARQLVRDGLTTPEEAVRVSRRDTADIEAPLVVESATAEGAGG